MEFNLADLFEIVVDAVPEREAVVVGDRRLSYGELEDRVNRLAHHLAANGVGAGDHVALYLYNGSKYLEAMLAVYKLRAVPVNVNFCLTASIEKEPEKVQAFTNALWRSMQWIKANSPENILGTIERFVGSTSREANLLEIGELKDVADWNGLITPESYARGGKVWYGELTGIKQPIKH